MKNCFSVPSPSLVVILDVEEKLDPPEPETVVSLGSRDSNWATAESMVILVDLLEIAYNLLTVQSMKNSRSCRASSSCEQGVFDHLQ